MLRLRQLNPFPLGSSVQSTTFSPIIVISIANLHSTPFAIDHFTGRITTKDEIDYESMRRSYKLNIRASDWGQPFRREAEVTLRIDIRG